MIPPNVVRVLASVRVPSSHGPEVDYELLHAIVNSGPNVKVTHEAILLRLVVGNTPQNSRAFEILMQDVPAVQAQWTRFVQDVLWRRAQAGDQSAQDALDKMNASVSHPAPVVYVTPGMSPPMGSPAISASGGRHGNDGGAVPFIPAKKEKQRSGEPAPPPQVPLMPSMGPKRASDAVQAGMHRDESQFDAPKKSPVPDHYEVIGFSLAAPPTADGLLKTLQADHSELYVVAPMSIAPKVEEFVVALKEGRVKGRPTNFNPIVIRRDGTGPVSLKKLRADIAGGIAQMLGETNSVLWILP